MNDFPPDTTHAKRRLAAVVFTDVVGYSTKMQGNETATISDVGSDLERMRRMCVEHDGQVLNSMGDGLMLSFPSAVQAVTFALKVQAAFALRKSSFPAGKVLEHRIGMHLGDVISLENGSVAGDGVNIASRLEAKAPPGGICISQTVYETVKGKVPMQATFLGPEKFKNIAEPIPIYHIASPTTEGESVTPLSVRSTTKRRAVAGVLVALIVFAGFGSWFWYQRTAPLTAGVADAKSIAVLPFVNTSDDKDNSLFFADGMHEDILTNLALIRELRVVSRTSVMQYRATTKPIRQIGQELGVAYLLEGSVRRVGIKVRVTGQLINARTDEHVWAKSYDRDLTDIFTIQAALAQEIAASLKAALSPQEQSFINRRPTDNIAAYDLFLQARNSANRDIFGPASFKKRQDFLEKAVALDPNFAGAWGELSVVHATYVFGGIDTSDARLAKAGAASDKSVQLAAESPDVMRALGTYYYYGYRDYAKAKTQFEKLAQLQPNDPAIYFTLGAVQRRQGQWAESLANFRKAARLEPGNIQYARNLLDTLYLAQRYEEVMTEQRRIIALLPLRAVAAARLSLFPFFATGSTKESDDWIAQLPTSQLDSPPIRDWRKYRAEILGDFAEFRRLDRLQPYYEESLFGEESAEQALAAAIVYAANSDSAGARTRLENHPQALQARLEREPTNARLLSQLGMMEAVLGNKQAAVRYAQRAVALMPESRDAVDGPEYSRNLAFVYAWTGDTDRAIAELSRLFRLPLAQNNVHEMRRSAFFAPLRGDPRFEALLADPKNNAPKF